MDSLREVESQFAIIKTINNVDALENLSIMESLDRENQINLALALVSYANKGLINSNNISLKQGELLDFFFEMKKQIHFYPPTDRIFQLRQILYEKRNIKRLSKVKAKSLLKKEIKTVLGDPSQKGSELSYLTKIGKWYVETLIDVDFVLTYSHIIYTKEFEPDILKRSMILTPGAGVDFLRWLGMGSTGWLILGEEDVLNYSQSLKLVCSHFFDAIAILLSDISF